MSADDVKDQRRRQENEVKKACRDFRRDLHGMLDDYLDEEEHEVSLLKLLLHQVATRRCGIVVGVELVDPDEDADFEITATGGGIEVVKA